MLRPVRSLEIKNLKLEITRRRRGFTLIELLIVIAVIGILATAVLSAINPVEQIRKGRDAGKKSDAAEFLNSVERYFTTFEKYPWYAITNPLTTPPSEMTIEALATSVAELELKKELKPQFQDRANLDELYVTEDEDELVHVCFAPESQTQREKAEAEDGNLIRTGQSAGLTTCNTNYPPDTAYGTDTCHICVPE